MNLSKIWFAARSQQLLHVFRAYLAPTLRISLVIISRQPYALSLLSLTTDYILATQIRQHRGLQGVVITNKNVSYYKHRGSAKSPQILWQIVPKKTALHVHMTCRSCSDVINKARNIFFLPDCHCRLGIWQPMAKVGPTRWTGACSCPHGKAWRCVAAGPWAPLALVHL